MFTVVLSRWIRLRELMAASTRYFPNLSIATTCIFSGMTTSSGHSGADAGRSHGVSIQALKSSDARWPGLGACGPPVPVMLAGSCAAMARRRAHSGRIRRRGKCGPPPTIFVRRSKGGIRPRIAVRAIPGLPSGPQLPAHEFPRSRRAGLLVGGDASAPHRRSEADGPGLCVTRAARRIDSCLSVQERVSSCSPCDADRGAAGCVSRSMRAVSAPVRTVRGSQWTRPAGRWLPRRRPPRWRRHVSSTGAGAPTSLAHVCEPRQADGPRTAGEVTFRERAVELMERLSLPGGAARPHDGPAVDPHAVDGVDGLIGGPARCRHPCVRLVQVEAVGRRCCR